ncbi:hypothetical protein HZS_7201 [Henneguya salminicola]|nr:hypothetical protein HZS_7201 [Henneguya salminicola]
MGAYNTGLFNDYLLYYFQKEVFQRNPMTIMKNVRLHHSEYGIQKLTAFNIIENLSGTIKGNVNSIRPKPKNKNN